MMIFSIGIASVAVLFFLRRLFARPKSLQDDVILVTGAGHGIGRLLCMELSKHCRKIIGWDINQKGLLETAEIVKSVTGVIMKCQQCDVSNQDQINDCITQLQNEFGRVTILINSAGIVIANYFAQLSKEKFEKIMKTNLFAPFYITQAVLPGMLGSAYEKALMSIPKAVRVQPIKQQLPDLNAHPPRGHLVFITSVAGVVPAPGLSDYCATKSGLIMLSDNLRMELEKMGVGQHISVTDIRPYAINTGMFTGVHSKVSFILPILRQEDVAKRTVQSILWQEDIVYIPWHASLLPIVVNLFPNWMVRIILKLSGASDGMDDFEHADLSE